jgi:hypothetical protein
MVTLTATVQHIMMGLQAAEMDDNHFAINMKAICSIAMKT